MLKQETEIRQLTRRELLQRPSEKLVKKEDLLSRCHFLESQLNQLSGLTEQLNHALCDQHLTIKDQQNQISKTAEDFQYAYSFVSQKLDDLSDDIKSAFYSPTEFRPKPF